MTYQGVDLYDDKTSQTFTDVSDRLPDGREPSSLGIQGFANNKLVRVSAIDAPA